MNTLSIEIQPYFSFAVLQEKEGVYATNNIIGDGYREAIPNVFDKGKWASTALVNKQNVIINEAPFYNLYEKPELVGAFLQGYLERVRSFIGFTDPYIRNGYQSVGILHTDNFAKYHDIFLHESRQCGLSGSLFIPADLAIFCKWLALPASLIQKPGHVIIVVIGELLTTVSLYNTSGPSFVSETTLPYGFMTWLSEFCEYLKKKISASEVSMTMEMYDGMTDFLKRMIFNEKSDARWTGMYKKQLLSKIALPDKSVFEHAGFSLNEFWNKLQQSIRKLTAHANISAGADIVISGKGSLFPQGTKHLRSIPDIAAITQINEEVANGGLLWPVAAEKYPSLHNRMQINAHASKAESARKRINP